MGLKQERATTTGFENILNNQHTINYFYVTKPNGFNSSHRKK